MDDELLRVHDLRLVASGRTLGAAPGAWLATTGVDNLLQAIWMRLNTPLGALSELGHPDYGSRLFRLIGELDGPVTRDRARLYVASALRREPRISKILSIHVTGEVEGTSMHLIVTVAVLPVGHAQPLSLRFPVYLDTARDATP